MSFADTIDAPTVHINMKRIFDTLCDLNENKAILEPILNKWIPREVDLEFMCVSYDEVGSDATIKSTCELTKGLTKLAEGKANVERKANLYRKEYTKHIFELFPGGFVNQNQIKDKQVWLDELGANLSLRVNEIINKDDTSLFVKTIEEIEKIKSHYGFLESEVRKIRNSWKRLLKLKKKIIGYSWPIDDVFQEWSKKYTVQEEDALEQLQEVATEQKVQEVEDAKRTCNRFLESIFSL